MKYFFFITCNILIWAAAAKENMVDTKIIKLEQNIVGLENNVKSTEPDNAKSIRKSKASSLNSEHHEPSDLQTIRQVPQSQTGQLKSVDIQKKEDLQLNQKLKELQKGDILQEIKVSTKNQKSRSNLRVNSNGEKDSSNPAKEKSSEQTQFQAIKNNSDKKDVELIEELAKQRKLKKPEHHNRKHIQTEAILAKYKEWIKRHPKKNQAANQNQTQEVSPKKQMESAITAQ